MKATIVDMRRNPRKILDAIARKESVTLTERGKEVARIQPIAKPKRPRVQDLEAFGMWADRDDMKDPTAFVRELRKGRFDDL